MRDLEIPAPSASPTPAADVIVTPASAGPIIHQSFPVRQPEEDANEIMIGIRARVLRRIRNRLGKLAKPAFPWPDMLIGIATLCLGSWLGALASNLPWAVVNKGEIEPTIRAIIFYVIMPVLGVASLVAFFCIKHLFGQRASDVASSVLEELPDPDHTL
jgi:hypothetical protein